MSVVTDVPCQMIFPPSLLSFALFVFSLSLLLNLVTFHKMGFTEFLSLKHICTQLFSTPALTKLELLLIYLPAFALD